MPNKIEYIEYLINELKKYKALIADLKKEELYISHIDYDWDENSFIYYDLFDLDEYIYDWMYQFNQNQKKKTK